MGVPFRCTDNHCESDRKWTEIREARTVSEPLHKTGIIMADTSPTLTVGGDRTTGQSVRTQNGLFLVENIDWKFLQHCFVFFISCIHTVRLYCYCLCSSHGKHMATRMFHMFGLVWRGWELKLKSKRILWLILIYSWFF